MNETLPVTMRRHLNAIKMPQSQIRKFIREVMSSEQKQNDYLKVIEEYNRQTEG